MMFAGRTSPWTRPAWCRAASASATSIAISTARRGFKGRPPISSIQPLAGHILEGEEHLPVLEPALVEHRDARVRDGLQRLGGGLQGHGALRVRRQRGRHPLDDDSTSVDGVTRAKGFAKRASADALDQLYEPSATGTCAPADSGEGSVTSLTSSAAATA